MLLNLYNDTVAKTQPVESALDDERLEAIASRCVALADTDTPNLALARLERDQLAEMVIRLSIKLHESRATLEPTVAIQGPVPAPSDEPVAS